MKIAIVTRMLQKGKIEGIGMFANETIKRIVAAHPEHEYVFLFDRPFDNEFIPVNANVRPVKLSFPARHTLQLAYWYQVALKRYLQKNQPDILISPDGSIPLHSPVPTL